MSDLKTAQRWLDWQMDDLFGMIYARWDGDLSEKDLKTLLQRYDLTDYYMDYLEDSE